MNEDSIRERVREHYARAATGAACCGGGGDSRATAVRLGYGAEELDHVPDEANLGLGCGNPAGTAGLRPGEVVVDLGSGPGLDALLAARAVGPTGRVIGIDMTSEMLALSRANAVEAGVAGFVEFREGTIEELPVVSGSADVVISNCVINLSPDKGRVFREAHRVLRAGGRLAVSDIVLTEPLPAALAGQVEAWCACLAGALLADEYLARIREAGFADVRWTRVSAADLLPEASGLELLARSVWSYRIEATKP